MESIKNINWKNDDGVFLPMLNDFRRNQFYDRVLATAVKDQECVDIGFGTGLLSMIALKHGAKHITAYEADEKRFQLGQYVIQQLNLSDKIDLVNQKFESDQYHENRVYFSEIVGTGIWSENLFQVIPHQPGIKFLPARYFLELYTLPIPENFANRLFQHSAQHSYFAPGIDIDCDFVELINNLMGTTQPPAENISGQPHHHNSTVWGGWSFLRAVQFDRQPVACYTVDVDTQIITKHDSKENLTTPIDFRSKFIELQIEIDSTPTLLVPRVGFEFQNQKLILDTAESWGPADGPFIVWDQRTVFIKHCLNSGIITYSR